MIKSIINPVFLSLCLVPFFSCEKEKIEKKEQHVPVTTNMNNGLPDSPVINGHFYACCNTQSFNGSVSRSQIFHASFGDPAKELLKNFDHLSDVALFSSTDMGNVSVGEVWVSDFSLRGINSGNTFRYSGTGSNTNFNYSTAVSIGGNGSFVPFNLTVPRGFPVITVPATTFTLSRSAGGTIDVGSFISNYDSVIVRFSQSSFSTNIKKRINHSTSLISFTDSDLSTLSTGQYQQLSFLAFNYSNKTVQDKSYVFELCNKTSLYITIAP